VELLKRRKAHTGRDGFMMGPYIILIDTNVGKVSEITGKSEEELREILTEYMAQGIHMVKIPILVKDGRVS
jgi:hypothetical protein